MGTQSIALLTEGDWTFIEASLSNGVGLTGACEGIGIDVKAMSAFLRDKPGTMAKCQSAVTMGYKALMTIINNHAADAKIAKWQGGHRALAGYIKSLNLWEQHCQRDEVTPQKVSEAFYTYRQVPEVATVLGMTTAEFYVYVLGDANLKNYLLEAGFITG